MVIISLFKLCAFLCHCRDEQNRISEELKKILVKYKCQYFPNLNLLAAIKCHTPPKSSSEDTNMPPPIKNEKDKNAPTVVEREKLSKS